MSFREWGSPNNAGSGGGGTVPDNLPMQAVADTTALGALSITALDDGSVVSMRSVKDLWYLDKTSTLTADGITIIAASGGTGRWIRMIQSHLSWRKQTAWFIDQGAGDDENDGAALGTALASHDEFQRRVADEDQPIDVDMVVTFSANYTGDIENTVSVSQISPYGSITYSGQRTVAFSGSITATTPWTTGTTAGTLTDSGLAVSFAASGGLGKLCVLTSGASSGAASWLTLESVAKTVRYSGFFNDSTFAVTDPNATDTYDVVDLTQITGKVTQVGDGYTVFKNIAFRSPGGFDTQVQVYGGYLAFTFCDIECNTMNYSGGGTFGHAILGSKINAATGRPKFFNCDISMYASWFLSNAPFASSGSRINLPARNVAQQESGGAVIDKSITAEADGRVTIVLGGEWCVLDLVSAASRALRCGKFGRVEVDASSVVWGLGNTMDHAVEVDSGGTLIFAQPAATRFQVSGTTVSEVLVGAVQSTFAGLPVNDLGKAAFASEL
jgi:hypothetical protein